MSRPCAAFQGAPGAFSHEALLRRHPELEPVGFDSFEETFAAVARGECACAFLPVENTIAGPVTAVADRLASSGLRTAAEHLWPVRIQLLGAPGGRLEDVRTAASHPVALRQCGRFLHARGIAEEAAYDTAGAAKALSEAPDRTRAALASRVAALLYGLAVLAEDVQDRDDNVTRFLLLKP